MKLSLFYFLSKNGNFLLIKHKLFSWLCSNHYYAYKFSLFINSFFLKNGLWSLKSLRLCLLVSIFLNSYTFKSLVCSILEFILLGWMKRSRQETLLLSHESTSDLKMSLRDLKHRTINRQLDIVSSRIF